ncbi:hypothetical protein E3C22_02695 [Jiella endophytica]|uniref:Uncharacterized protein n=1 Tax=Jiella endophytica TaxID=2558362 RepID=A0A4Y8RVA3_9HYPH|nr:hypothetical protein [Jiella endophytica]TFF27384.1 hypothetical protein E3C22_02695 [Jiella endophytica]
MLHAFNQKNVRRVLMHVRSDHKIGKDEDGVTSMVFTPLAFMSAKAAAAVALEISGPTLADAFQGRTPCAHHIQLWPEGLRDRSWAETDRQTRCEPDFLLRFDFEAGPQVVLVGEVKWDWNVSSDHIQTEIDRQRRAVAAHYPDATAMVMVAITKYRLRATLANVVERTWVQLHGAANALRTRDPQAAEGRWGALVGEFLTRAEQIDFQGFTLTNEVSTPNEPVFWRETT